MKIIVKLQLEPEEKEVFEGDDLTAAKVGSDDHPILVISNGGKKLAEFTHWIYWVVEGEKDEMQVALADKILLLKKIRDIISVFSSHPEKQVDKIIRLLDDEDKGLFSQGIHLEPDRDALILNLRYLDHFVRNDLSTNYATVGLSMAIYALQKFVEDNEIPKIPIDPTGDWETFNKSFEKLPLSEKPWRG